MVVIQVKVESYEIWKHEGKQTWEVFPNVNDELRNYLSNNGWTPVLLYAENENLSEKISDIKLPKRRK